MGVGRKGIRVWEMREVMDAEARAYAAPLPITMRGERAVLRSCATLKSVSSSAEGLGGVGRGDVEGRSVEEDKVPWIMSAGRSMKEGPGRPYQAVRYAFFMASGTASCDVVRRASFV